LAPRFQIKLGGDMRQLGLLRRFQRGDARRPIGAAILPVRIEEQVVEPIIKVIMMGDVAL
jgi:hypothetical protein